MQALCLRRGDDPVVQALEQQDGAVDLVCPPHRGPGLVRRPVLGKGAHQPIQVMRFEVVGRGRQSAEVADPVPRGRGGERSPVGQRVERRQPARTGPPHGHAGAVHLAVGGQEPRRIGTVLGVDHPPLPPERAAVVPPVAGAARVVHGGQGEATAGEVLRDDVEACAHRSGGSGVAHHHQRWEGIRRTDCAGQQGAVDEPMDPAPGAALEREGLADGYVPCGQ